MSRSINSIRNVLAAFFNQFIIIVLNFVVRTIFIKILGNQYLGIGGLFLNILSMLSLAEMGLGSAIAFHMYKPLAQNDEKQIHRLLLFYKTVYRYIGFIILIAGLVLLPFLPNLIKEVPTFINIYFAYLIYLSQSVSTYFFMAYKSTLFRADQKTYVINSVSNNVTVITAALQILVLIFLKNFYVYVGIQTIMNIIQSLIISGKCNKQYPFLKKKSKEKLPKEDIREIYKDCTAMLIYRINGVVVNATDSIFLSKFAGVAVLGNYANYTLISNCLQRCIKLVFNSITSSIGNLNASGSEDRHQVEVFNVIKFIAFVINSVCAVGIFVVVNPFVTWWIGEKYLLPRSFVLIFSLNFYLQGMQKVTNIYRNALGLFQQAKYRPVAGALINIVVSLLLVKPYGITGVLLGTFVSGLLTYTWFDPLIIFKYGFHLSPIKYFITSFKYIAITCVCAACAYLLVDIVEFGGLAGVLFSGMISVFVTAIGILICSVGSLEFKKTLKYVGVIIRNFNNRDD